MTDHRSQEALPCPRARLGSGCHGDVPETNATNRRCRQRRPFPRQVSGKHQGRAANFTGQSVLRAGQSSFNGRTPLLNGPVGTPFDKDGLAEPGQRFGIALFPKRILESHRQNDSLLQAACEMRHSRLNARRPFCASAKRP